MLAILIPAVQNVRETARRNTCQNNLRQLALAIQAHESSHKAIPSLYFGTFLKQPRNAFDEFHFHSWRTAILPQLEQNSLYQRINLNLPATDALNQANLNTAIAVFECPSTNNHNTVVPDIYAFNDGAIPTKKIGTAARNDYEAIAGVHFPPTPPAMGSADLRGIRFGVWGEPQYNPNTGKSLGYRMTRFRDVSDGLSNTMLVAERAGRPDLYRRGKPVDPYPNSRPDMGMDHHQAAWGISTHIWWLVFQHDQAINDTNATGLYSFHPSGANVAFADGSECNRFFAITLRTLETEGTFTCCIRVHFFAGELSCFV